VLIDHGSSAVLISEEYAAILGLHRERLPEPYTAELTMENNGQKVEVTSSKYVKLQLHDPSSYWSSKTACAIIAPGLCSPMILGLPFLSHNNIVVNASARTVIDKKCGFNLLHPVAPVPPPPAKKKLKTFFKELQEDRKLMVAKLKMVCHDRLQHTRYRFKKVQPIDHIAAIRQRIEVLAAQNKLLRLGEQMKSELKTSSPKFPILINFQPTFIVRYDLKMHQNLYRRIHTALPRNIVKPGQY
jgi:hypothetical protein